MRVLAKKSVPEFSVDADAIAIRGVSANYGQGPVLEKISFDVKKGDKMYREDSVRVKIW